MLLIASENITPRSTQNSTWALFGQKGVKIKNENLTWGVPSPVVSPDYLSRHPFGVGGGDPDPLTVKGGDTSPPL